MTNANVLKKFARLWLILYKINCNVKVFSYRLIIRKYYFLILFFALLQTGIAQKDIDLKQIEYYPKSFFGIGHGINAYTGLVGVMVEYPVDDHFSMFFSGGIGSWGYKAGGGIGAYLIRPQAGPSFSIGYSHAFGIKKYIIELETITGNYEQVSMILKPAHVLQMMFHYNFKVLKASKMVIGSGFGLKLNKNAYQIQSYHILSDRGKQMMNILQPGGIILSFTFMFGLR